MDLLYCFSEFYCLMKSHIHTEDTVKRFEIVTSDLGKHLRYFQQKICLHYKTKELPKEARARRRQKDTLAAATTTVAASASLPQASALSAPLPTQPAPKSKTFSLSNVKLHMLADMATFIPQHGALVGCSTQTVGFGPFSPNYLSNVLPSVVGTETLRDQGALGTYKEVRIVRLAVNASSMYLITAPHS